MLGGANASDGLRPHEAVDRPVVEPERAKRDLEPRVLRVHVRAGRRCENQRRHAYDEKRP